MQRKILIARLMISGGVALASFIAAAASAAVEPGAVGAAGIDWQSLSEAAQSSFLFN